MWTSSLRLGLAAGLAASAYASDSDSGRVGGLEVIFAGDIGHAREGKDDYTSPWPMDKSAWEGAFSLYDGLKDYVENQGARPDAVMIAGDVAYGGGSQLVNNNTAAAFQKYLNGVVAPDMVFPVIGNHDINFLGCTLFEASLTKTPCYYGTNYNLRMHSSPQLSYFEWKANWVGAFPGLQGRAISPPSQVRTWQAPTRYNLNLKKRSSVYIIAGLLSGSWKTTRTDETPVEATDAADSTGGADLQCNFLEDSLAEGRRLGKSVFIYVTHHFAPACSDWTLIQQIDVWIVGHKHNYWQNVGSQGLVTQEDRHYPLRILVGNGGFDEGKVDVVNFVHMKEKVFKQKGVDRVRLTFEVKDTCISDQACPSGMFPNANCWKTCKNMTGGYDGGNGPRKATPSKHGWGMIYEAPRKPKAAAPKAPFRGNFKLQLGPDINNETWWVGTDTWDSYDPRITLIRVDKEEDADIFTFYDGDEANNRARIALWDEARGPLLVADDSYSFHRNFGFWETQSEGEGKVRPSDGFMFNFESSADGKLLLKNAKWERVATGNFEDPEEQVRLILYADNDMEMTAHPATIPQHEVKPKKVKMSKAKATARAQARAAEKEAKEDDTEMLVSV